MSSIRSWLARPIADDDRRRAFAVAAATLLITAAVLTVTADPPDRTSSPPPVERPGAPPTDRPAVETPPAALGVARRFVDGYLAYLYGDGRARDIRGASDGLRRQLSARPVRVSPAMRGERPRIGRIDGQRFDDGWLIDAKIATATVSFPMAVVVADRPGGPVVTRLVED
jgi:hypothetical protein